MKKIYLVIIFLISGYLLVNSSVPVFAETGVNPSQGTETGTTETSEQLTTETTEQPVPPVVKKYKAKWIKKKGGFYYRKSDGSIVRKKGTMKIGKYWYFLEKGGKRLSGFRKSNKKLYYYSPKNGRRVVKKGWIKIKGKKYYIQKGGSLAVGIKKIGKQRYGFTKNGELRGFTKPFEYEGKWYRTDKNGVAERLNDIQVKCSRETWDYIDKYTSSGMSNEEKFRTLFNKMMTGNYVPGCIKRSETEEKDFPYHIAYNVFINGRINCYGFACSIASIAKELGYEPYVIIMNYDHAVVEIDGKYYDNMGARFGASQPAITDFEVEQKVKF